MDDGKNLFDQPVENNKATYENIRNVATDQGDGYTTGYLLDCIYIKQAYDADPKAIQQNNVTANLDRAGMQESISFLMKRKNLS